MLDRTRFPRAASTALAVAAAAVLALPAPGAAQAPTNTPGTEGAPLNAGFVLPGDRIQVQVWRQPEFSGEFFVTEAGVIGHPIFRTIGRVSGRNVEEIQPLIEEFLRQYEQEPNVVVEVFFRVAVGGEVRQPNVHFLRPGTTIAQAISLAGGVTDRGKTDEVILRRRDRDYTLDLSDPALPDQRSIIFSGDQITVQRKVSVFREYVLPTVGFLGSVAAIYNVFRR